MSTKMSLDGLVLPDETIYKGWSGSKITVTQKADGSYRVNQSIGTIIMNSLGNVLIWFENLGVPKNEKKDYYKYYNTEKELQALESKSRDNASNWKNQLPNDYLNQNSNTRSKKTDNSNMNFNFPSIINDNHITQNDNSTIINNVMEGLANNIINEIGDMTCYRGCTK